MKRFIGPIIALAVTAALSHLAVLYSAPPVIMSRAMAVLEQRDVPLHGFWLGQRMTPKTQTVVRPSPDLAYSACRYDLSQAPGGLRVNMAAYDGYSSLSFFDGNTINFLTVRGNGAAHEVVLLAPGSEAASGGATVSPTEKGVILIRRLAPSQADYDKVVSVASGDGCSVVK